MNRPNHLSCYLDNNLTPSLIDSIKLHSSRGIVPAAVKQCLVRICKEDNKYIDMVVEHEKDIETFIYGPSYLDEILNLREKIDQLKRKLKPDPRTIVKTKGIKSEIPVQASSQNDGTAQSENFEPLPENIPILTEIKRLETEVKDMLNRTQKSLDPRYLETCNKPQFNTITHLLKFKIYRAINKVNATEVLELLSKAYFYSRSRHLRQTIAEVVQTIENKIPIWELES